MAMPWNKRNVQVQIEEMKKQNVPVFAGDMNLDRTGKGRDVQNINVGSVTWVNELGRFGALKLDSNGDDIADGWVDSLDAAAVPDLVGGKYQSITTTHDSYSSRLSYDIVLVVGDIYYISGFCYRDEYGGLMSGRIVLLTGSDDFVLRPATAEKWGFVSKVITSTSSTGTIRIYSSSADGVNASESKYKDIKLINLTKMRHLPLFLNNYFGKEKWEDLTASEVDEVMPIYLHAVECSGYNYTNGAYEPVFKNNGKNISNFLGNTTYTFQTTIIEEKPEENFFITKQVTNSAYTRIRKKIKNLELGKTYTVTAFVSGDILPATCISLMDQDGVFLYSEFGKNELSLTFTHKYGDELELRHNRYGDILGANSVINWQLQLEEGSTATAYTPPKKDSIILPELNGLGGTYDDLNYKRIHRETVTIETNSATASKSGTGSCVLISSTGDVVWGTISGTTISATTANGDYTAIYKLSTAETQSSHVNLMSKYLEPGHNNFIGTGYNLDEFDGDGSTTVFTLSTTADDTNYDVLVAGIKQESGVTKTTTNFTFDSAPKNGAIIEAEYNRTTNSSWFATLNVYEPSGTLNTRAYEMTISAQSNSTFFESTDQLGNVERVEQSKDYTVNLTFRIFENVKKFSDEWRGKKFRIIIENTAETATTYTKDIFAVCEIIDSSVDYIEGTETVTIKATDFYQGVS